MSFLDSLFGNEDPAKAANKYMSRIPNVGKQYYNPFIQGGQEAGNTLHSEYGKMLDPTTFIDNIMGHYKTSKGAELERDELGRGIGATAAAGGFAGTPEHQREYGEMAGNIMSKDMQQYLQNALGVYSGGLTGEKDFFNKGFDASGSMADLLGGNLASQGTLAFQGVNQQNENRQALMKALSKLLATGTGAYFGGSEGAEIGSKMFA